MQMNDHDYRCTMRYSAESDSLFIENCTPAMRDLFNISANGEGFSLGEQLSTPIRRWIYHTFRYLTRGKRSILAFKECGGRFAAIKMSYDAPLLSIYLQPLSDDMFFNKLYYSNNLSRLSADRFFNSFKFSMMLARQGDHFEIECIDERATEAFSITKDDKFDAVIKNFCCIESDRVLHYCLDNYKFLYCADVYDNNDSISYYIIGMIPSSCGRITLTFHSLKQHEYYRLISGCVIDNDVPASDMNIGIAVFKAQIHKTPFLVKHNNSYDMLTCDDSDSYYIINSLILKSRSTSTVVSTPRRFGNTDCIAAAIPFPKDDQVFAFIFPVETTTASPTIIDEKLTTRENEIAALISSGKSNTEISSICGISVGTVKKTIANIYSKLNVSSRAELVRLVLLHSDRADQL